jgi:hypothetical protein
LPSAHGLTLGEAAFAECLFHEWATPSATVGEHFAKCFWLDRATSVAEDDKAGAALKKVHAPPIIEWASLTSRPLGSTGGIYQSCIGSSIHE